MKTLLLYLLLLSSLFSAKVVETHWLSGESFSTYLEDRNISLSLIESIESDDKQFLSEIQSGIAFYELFDQDGRLLQSLIPIGEEMQIQVVRDQESGDYSFDIIPISFADDEYRVVTPILINPYTDIKNTTGNHKLASLVNRFFKNSVNCRKLKKNDTIAMIYTQKERLGRPLGSPDLKIAMIETGGKSHFIYADRDGTPYQDTSKTVTYDRKGNPISTAKIRRLKRNDKFGMPLRHIRISSRFSYKRWHPILRRYRPHLGVDFAARRGTPLLAVAPGKVIYSGWKGGYGKVIKIKHSGGYVSLYAHQKSTRAKRGQKVKKGQIIGYVGSTGRSTGPHLHFGLYKNGRAVNPLKVLKKKSSRGLKSFITKKIEIKGAKENKVKILKMLEDPPKNFMWDDYKINYSLVDEKGVYDDRG